MHAFGRQLIFHPLHEASLRYHTVKGKELQEFLWLHLNGMNALGYYEEFVKNGFRILDIREKELTEQTLRKIIAINQKRADHRGPDLRPDWHSLTELIAQEYGGEQAGDSDTRICQGCGKVPGATFPGKSALQELADMLHVDRFYLIKEFGRYVGISPHEYQIELRISYAKELLKYSDLSVNEISLCLRHEPDLAFYQPFQGKGSTARRPGSEGMVSRSCGTGAAREA